MRRPIKSKQMDEEQIIEAEKILNELTDDRKNRKTDLIKVDRGLIKAAVKEGVLKEVRTSGDNKYYEIVGTDTAIVVVRNTMAFICLSQDVENEVKRLLPHNTFKSTSVDGIDRDRIRFCERGETCCFEVKLLANESGMSYTDKNGRKYTVNHIGFTFDDRRLQIELMTGRQNVYGHKVKIRLKSVDDVRLLAEFINLTAGGYYLDEEKVA